MSTKQTFIKLPVIKTPEKSPENTIQIDKYTMSANQIGMTMPQIAAKLSEKGYTASTVEVYESLSRQGVNVSMGWTVVAGVPSTILLHWDSWADSLVLTAHQLGHSTLQLLAELRWAGYLASIENVGASLDRQGVY